MKTLFCPIALKMRRRISTRKSVDDLREIHYSHVAALHHLAGTESFKMFAIIEDSGHQLRVETGQTLAIDLRSDAEVGQTITFDKVLLANGGADSVIGTPAIDGATVEAEVIDDLVKGPKLEVQKFRRRKNSRRHTGHRQKYTGVKITAINVPNLEVKEEKQEEAVAE